MRWWTRLRSWLRAVAHQSRTEREMDAELGFHIAAFAEDLARSGLSAEEAGRRARIEFGGIERAKEECRDARGVNFVEPLLQDLRFAFRMLRRSPGFTTVGVLTLALGIGANTAIFSLTDQAVLRWLPIKIPQQLFELHPDLLIPEYEKLAAYTQSFSEMFASDKGPMITGIDGESENIEGRFVSGSYYSVTGIHAILGRVITPQDDHPASPLVCVLNQSYWKRRFGNSAEVLGKTITLKRIPFLIIGVAPEFDAGKAADVIVPMATHLQLAMKDNDTVNMVGRLKPEVSEKRASAELTLVYRQILADAAGNKLTPADQQRIQEKTVQLIPAGHGGLHRFSMELRIAAAVVGIILLIASINVGNLLLARGTTRQREIAVRLAIGAGRWRIIRQLLTESILLAVLGGGLGLLLAWCGGQLLSALISGTAASATPDVQVLGFTGAVSLLTGIGCGLLPAMRATRTNLTPSLKAGGSGSGGSWFGAGGSRSRLGKGLVISQIGLCLTLLLGAGLLLESLAKLSKADVGFEREKVLLMWVLPTMVGYDTAQENGLYWQLLPRLNALPGVQSASLSRLQLFSGYWGRSVSVPRHASGTGEDVRVSCNTVAPRFFATMGIPLLSGRDFTPADTTTAPKVAIISESMAQHYFPGENPVGSHFRFTGEDGTDVEIVGVVKDILTEFREEQNHRTPRAAYIPFTQAPATMTGQAVVEVRAAENTGLIAGAMREVARQLDKDLPVDAVTTQNEIVEESLGRPRALTQLTALLGLLALLLASIGLYGTMSHAVAQRTKEIGIRMALGAERRNVLRMVLGEGMLLALCGISGGLALGAALTRLISSQLYGLSATDPLTFVTVSLLLAGVALLASYIPARRAMRVDPMVALKYE
jgi:predicted permease